MTMSARAGALLALGLLAAVPLRAEDHLTAEQVRGVVVGTPPGSISLAGKNISGDDLSVLDLSSADLRGANLSKANLHGAKLVGADLTGADLSVERYAATLAASFRVRRRFGILVPCQ